MPVGRTSDEYEKAKASFRREAAQQRRDNRREQPRSGKPSRTYSWNKGNGKGK